MKLLELFQAERSGNIQKINGEYYRIRQEHHDRFLGSEMIKNDLQENLQLWAEAEQVLLDLFQRIENNENLKNKIIKRVKIPSQRPARPLPTPSTTHLSDIPLRESVFMRFKHAYDLSSSGDYMAFRQEALNYRLASGLNKQKLKIVVQYMREVTAYIELDDLNVNHLWRLYQKNMESTVGDMLYQALCNQICEDDNLYIDEYINSVNALKMRLESLMV